MARIKDAKGRFLPDPFTIVDGKKVCTRCCIARHSDDYYSYSNICRQCHVAKIKIYKENHKEKYREYARKSNSTPERKAYMKAYREKHWPLYKQSEAYSAARKRYANSEKQKACSRRYFKTEAGLLKARLNVQNRRAQKIKTDDGTVTTDSIKHMILDQNSVCAICSISLLYSFDIDHIRPLSKGGIHSIKNIQILCPKCNRSKGNKYGK